MTSDFMEAVLTRFNRNLLLVQRKVVLIIDNATCHPIIFLLKNTTSRLQPLDAGIIQNFKVKYRKTLVKYVLARINDYSSAMQIIKDINILMAIRWAQEAMERSNRDDNEELFLRSVGLSKMMI